MALPVEKKYTERKEWSYMNDSFSYLSISNCLLVSYIRQYFTTQNWQTMLEDTKIRLRGC